MNAHVSDAFRSLSLSFCFVFVGTIDIAAVSARVEGLAKAVRDKGRHTQKKLSSSDMLKYMYQLYTVARKLRGLKLTLAYGSEIFFLFTNIFFLLTNIFF